MSITIDGEVYLWPNEAIKILDVKSKTTFYTIAHELPYTYMGKRKVYSLGGIKHYLERKKVEPCLGEKTTGKAAVTISRSATTEKPTGFAAAREQVKKLRLITTNAH